jgi:hypothetical protein
MRWMVFTGLALLLPTVARAQVPDENRSGQRDQLPAATAEPDNADAYAPPMVREDEGPSLADRGPAQKPFILASEPDDLASEDNPPTVENIPPDKVALDKKIHISLIHDVDNNGSYRSGSNHALQFEIKYINWGAVTAEQLEARRGHYFTISWVNHGPTDNFTARFEYRQVKSKEIVRTLTETMNKVSGSVRSYFGVVGKAYLDYGPVASWRISILKGDTVVAQERSFLW